MLEPSEAERTEVPLKVRSVLAAIAAFVYAAYVLLRSWPSMAVGRET